MSLIGQYGRPQQKREAIDKTTKRLQDEERSGKPAKFSMEQVVELFALACCEPEDYGRPISDWTARELAEEIVKQGIDISVMEHRH